MYNLDNFTKKAVISLKNAVRSAGELGHTYVGTEHIILGFLIEGTNIAGSILKSHRITENRVYEYIKRNKKKNATKADLIEKIANLIAENAEKVNILNPERQISFTIGENTYEITLSQKRKPKS